MDTKTAKNREWTIDELIEELERELKMRSTVYKKQIHQGRMKREEANERYSKIFHTIKLLEVNKRMIEAMGFNPADQLSLFQ